MYKLSQWQFNRLNEVVRAEHPLIIVPGPLDTDAEDKRTKLFNDTLELDELIHLGLLEDKSVAFAPVIERHTAALDTPRSFRVLVPTLIGGQMFEGDPGLLN